MWISLFIEQNVAGGVADADADYLVHAAEGVCCRERRTRARSRLALQRVAKVRREVAAQTARRLTAERNAVAVEAVKIEVRETNAAGEINVSRDRPISPKLPVGSECDVVRKSAVDHAGAVVDAAGVGQGVIGHAALVIRRCTAGELHRRPIDCQVGATDDLRAEEDRGAETARPLAAVADGAALGREAVAIA